MIRFACGNPGAGKGLYAVRLIVDELVNGNRPVFTNLALDIGGLNEYIQITYPHANVDVLTRIKIIGDDDVTTFYLHRGKFGSVEEDKENDRLKFGSDCRGIFWVLDEVQNFFNARKWAKTGSNALFYCSQHRKLGDDVWLITQHPNNVDKQFRSVAQDYVYLRNLSNERRGIFRLPSQFTWSQYLEPKTGLTKATAVGTFRLDVTGLGSCYYTAAGVGVPGTGEADTKKRKHGIAWQWAIVAVLAFLAIAVFVLTDGTEWLVRKALPQIPVETALPVKPAPAPDRPAGATNHPAPSPPAVPATTPPIPEPRPIVGYAKHGKAMLVYFVDGSVETLGESEVFYGERGVILHGQKHLFAAKQNTK